MSNNYWLKREQQRLNNIDSIVDEHINSLESLIVKSADNLDKEILKLYVKYADDNNMSYQSTLDYLTDDDRKEFQKDLKYYIDSYKNKENALVYRSELQALSTRARVKRLEKLKAALLVEAGRLHEYLMTDTKDMLLSIYEESYLHKMYSIDQAGFGVRFDLPPVGIINELLNYPWSGKNYSSKVWDKTNNFTEKVGEVMNQGLVQGKPIDSIVKDMRNSIVGKKGKGGRIYDYKRLVRTEAAFIAEQATIRSYNDANVEKYEYLATLDLRTSVICQRLDGKKFLVKDAKTMVNYPPMHAFCRSTTIPVIEWDGEEEEPEERIARDPITGKNYYTKDTSYDDWKDSIYSKYGKEVDIEQAKIKNKYNDILQYKRYKKELKDLVPKDFEMFQNLKYNNKEEWNKLAYRYKLETVYNLDRLKNTENFASKNAIKHILEGEINKRGKAVGFHLENLPNAKGKIIGQKTPEDKNGIYKAKVEVDGVVKDAKSTFFPTDMTPQQIVNAINEAYTSRESYYNSMLKGKTSYGFEIGMYLNENNKISTAFPIQKKR
ncbi:minor capsid protein [Paraclostridium sordellii]|uniref:minor capsid protein n=1 Tax=Paraclostridium sordellii TaxID=1505 RepID=UPI0013E0CA35|nr:minor capsid protein [Paeniclostridium sordellii]